MAPKLDYSMINGVGMWPLKKPFHIYLVLLVQRMPLLRVTWSFMVAPISGK
jgi:hypothetical protein